MRRSQLPEPQFERLISEAGLHFETFEKRGGGELFIKDDE